MNRLDMDAIRAALQAHAAEIAIDLLGEPNRRASTKRELRFGRKGGSLAMAIAGPKAGQWFDHATAQGGDLISLIRRQRGGSFRETVEYVEQIIGSVRPALPRQSTHAVVPERDVEKNTAFALQLWNEARDPRGTIVLDYLASRGPTLPDDIAGDVVRFHPTLKFDGASVGAMVALFRDITTNEHCGIHRTFLDGAGRKLDRKMLGRAKHAAIKLDADENVTLALHLGEGLETCLAARLACFRPVWALGSAGAIGALPVLPAIETITILGEVGDNGANDRRAQECATRWIEAGREAFIVAPLVGADFNDVWSDTQ